MVTDNNPEPENIEEIVDGNDETPLRYEDLVIEEPEREVSGAKATGTKTVSEAESVSDYKSDAQYLLNVINPHYPDKFINAMMQPVHVSRIFPDNFIDSCKMSVIAKLDDSDPSDNSDIWSIILAVHNAHSIGYEGRGISDRIEAGLGAREQDLEKLSDKLGLS